MLLSSGAAIALIIILALLISGGGSILLAMIARRTNSLVARIGIPFVALFGMIGGMWMYAKTSSVYEISLSEKNVYLVFGNATFTAGDGQKISIIWNSDEYYFVNVSDVPLYCEMVGYGIGFDFGNNQDPIKPHAFQMHGSAPDYYPWETPPSEIEVSGSDATMGIAFKLWVHE